MEINGSLKSSWSGSPSNEFSPESPQISSATLTAIVEYRLDPTENGTKLSKLFARPTGSFVGRSLMGLLVPVFKRFIQKDIESFKLEIENDYQAQSKVQ